MATANREAPQKGERVDRRECTASRTDDGRRASWTRCAPRSAATAARSPGAPRRPRRPRHARARSSATSSTRRAVDDVYLAAPTRPARTTATSPAWRSLLAGPARRGARARPSTGCARSGLEAVNSGRAPDQGRRGRPGARRRRRVDDPRAAGDAQARAGLPARRTSSCPTRRSAGGFVNPKHGGAYPTESMGETAENVAERYGVSREDQDAFALESHRRAVAAARRRAASTTSWCPSTCRTAQGRPA